jgi:protein SCO1
MNRSAMIKPHHALFALALLSGCGTQTAPALRGTDLAGSSIGSDFALIGRDGKPVRSADFAGKYRIVYFGYTFCPDACPTDVGVLMRGFRAFAAAHPDQAARVQPIFITVDPARDTAAKVGEFADAFGAPLIGLTGTSQQIRAATDRFHVYYALGAKSSGGYLIDHSRIAYLIGPDGKPIEGLPIEQGADAVAADLALAVK